MPRPSASLRDSSSPVEAASLTVGATERGCAGATFRLGAVLRAVASDQTMRHESRLGLCRLREQIPIDTPREGDGMISPSDWTLNVHDTAWVAASATMVGSVTVETDSSVWYSAVLRGDGEPISIGARTNVQTPT